MCVCVCAVCVCMCVWCVVFVEERGERESCVCVCVCGVCVGMFMWFMRTQICIMTWVLYDIGITRRR